MGTATATALMRAARLKQPGCFEVEERPRPEPGPGEVRIRLEGCGVCASNLEPWLGTPWAEYPFEPGAPGHEGWGVVDEVGRAADEDLLGRRVAALSYNAYAEYDIAPRAHVLPLPRELDGRDFPGEPLACAFNIFRRSQVRAGQTVAIVGIGFLGALLTKLAAEAGAHVIAITRRPFALELARRMGATDTIPMDDHGAILERVRELTAGEFCDRVIEAVGKQWPLDLAAELTRERGRLVIAGYHQDGPRQVNMQLWNWRGLDVVNAHERDPRVYLEGMKLAAEYASTGRLGLEPLLTHRYPLRHLGAALDAVHERPDGFLKAIVMPAEAT